MGEVSGEIHRDARLRRGLWRRWRRRGGIALALALVVALGVKAARDTLGDPIVRQDTLALPGLNPAAAPLRVLLISDIHVAGPDMPPSRLAHIVAKLNALHPDMVLIAGDFTSGRWLTTRRYGLGEALAPLAGLRSRLGTVAVLGNHDYERGASETRATLEALGVRVLRNEALRLGPVTLGGLGDQSAEDNDVRTTLAAMHRFGPPYILLAHEPDGFLHLTPEIPLLLAGHTHCGQIAPWPFGPIITGSQVGRRYACGVVHEHGAAVVVGAGLGTSDIPVRFGAHTDVWLLTLTP